MAFARIVLLFLAVELGACSGGNNAPGGGTQDGKKADGPGGPGGPGGQDDRHGDKEHMDPRAPVAIKVHGDSGKFTVYKKAAGEGLDRNQITIEAAFLKEVDVNGTPVGATGPKDGKHSINSFAGSNFAISPPTNVTLSPGNATALQVSFNASMATGGLVQFDVFIVTGNGTAGPEADWNVLAGDLKWNIQISNWSWCGINITCGQPNKPQTGAYLDFGLGIQGSNANPAPRGGGDGPGGKRNGTNGTQQPVGASANGSSSGGGDDDSRPRRGKDKNMTYSLGGAIDLDLTNVTTIDNVSTEMPTGYPMTMMNGAKTVFVFRFPLFYQSAVYDPILSTGTSDSVLTNTTWTTTGASTITITTTAGITTTPNGTWISGAEHVHLVSASVLAVVAAAGLL